MRPPSAPAPAGLTPLQRELLLADSFELARALYAAAERCHHQGLTDYARRFDTLAVQTWAIGFGLELAELPDAAE